MQLYLQDFKCTCLTFSILFSFYSSFKNKELKKTIHQIGNGAALCISCFININHIHIFLTFTLQGVRLLVTQHFSHIFRMTCILICDVHMTVAS